MSLTAAAERLRAERAVALNRCPVGTFVLTLSDDDAKALGELFANRDYTAEIIASALEGEGYRIAFTYEAIQSHRRRLRGGKGCKCPV